jgi:hypothetical protein
MAFSGDLTTARNRATAWRDSLLVDHAVFRVLWDNLAEVIPGKLYRSNHPTPARLAAAKRRYGLRTLINLRGHRQCGSDALSRRASADLGLHHIDMAFESRGAPHRDRILRFAEILFEGGTSDKALEQLSWRFGHWSRSRTGILDAFFIHYAATAEGRIPFLDWVEREYDEVALRRDFVAGGLSSFLVDRILVRE